jgi:hypothetical protein
MFVWPATAASTADVNQQTPRRGYVFRGGVWMMQEVVRSVIIEDGPRRISGQTAIAEGVLQVSQV